MNTILHTATNSFSHSDFLNLSEAGCPVLRSALVTTIASMYRTATVTLAHWPEWKAQIQEAAFLSLPVARISQGKPYCEFWDGPPIALTLGDAAGCFPGSARWASGARGARLEIDEKRVAPVTGGACSKRTQVQAIAYRHLLMNAFPPTLQVTVLKRLKKWSLVDPSQSSIPEFAAACTHLKKLRKHDAMTVIKTWANSWCTSYRYHEPVLLPCLLGCQIGKDCLSHYVDCIQIQLILDDLLLSPPKTPLERIGLQNVTRENILVASAIFAGYHSVKRSHRINGLNGSPLDYEHAIAAQRAFAEAFQVSADDVCLPCRSAGRFTPFFEQL